MERELLERLRSVFEDELADHRQVLEGHAEVLESSTASDEEKKRAGQEIYRAIHSIKGAARAVEESDLESFCHGLEQRIPEARHGVLNAQEVLDVAREALRRIAGRTVAVAPAEASPGVAMPAMPKSSPVDSMRLPVAEIGEIVRRAEDLLRTANLSGIDDARWDALTRTLGALDSRIEGMRRVISNGFSDSMHAASAIQVEVERSSALLSSAQTMIRERLDAEHNRYGALSVAVRDLSERARRLGLVSLATLGPLLENAVSETAIALNKVVSFQFSAQGVQVDRRVRDGLREPLLHLVRNAVDHGVETGAVRTAKGKPAEGRVWIKARIAGRDVHVTVGDDGAGFDFDSLRQKARERGGADAARAPDAELRELAFEPGVSTRREATVISGRGIGLDIVRQRVSALHGNIQVRSLDTGGTLLTLTVPVDLSVVPCLVVSVRGAAFVIATTSVERVSRVPREALVSIEGRMHVSQDGDWTPVADLAQMLKLSGEARPEGRTHETCVVLYAAKRRALMQVDEILEQRELVIRSLSPRIRAVPFVTAAAILPNGSVAPVLDGAALARRLRAARYEAAPKPPRPSRILVADDSLTTRELLRTLLESMGYEVATVPDGEIAWATLTTGNEHFDLLLSDIEMPRLDGFKLLARVRAAPTLAHLPVVLVTALESDEHRQRASALGASAYVAKGRFDQTALLAIIESLT